MKRPDKIKSFKLFENSNKDIADDLLEFLKRPEGYVDFMIKQEISRERETGRIHNPLKESEIIEQKRTGRIYYKHSGGSTYTDCRNGQYTLESVYGGQIRYSYTFDIPEELERTLVINTVYIGVYLVKKQEILDWMKDPKNYKEFFENGYTKKELGVRILSEKGEEVLDFDLDALLATKSFKLMKESAYEFSIRLDDKNNKGIGVGSYINPILDFLRYKPAEDDNFHGDYKNFHFNIKTVPIKRGKKNNERWIGESKAIVRTTVPHTPQSTPGGFNFIIINDAPYELIMKDLLYYYFSMLRTGIGRNRIDRIAKNADAAIFILEVNEEIARAIIDTKSAKNVINIINDMIAKEPGRMAMALKPHWNKIKKDPALKGIKGSDEFMKDAGLTGDLYGLGF